MGFTTQDQQTAFRDGVRLALAQQVENAPADTKTCILSSEHLHSRLKTSEHIERVKNLLLPLFDDIEIHLHLRPQVDVVVSLASTQTRVGGAVRKAFFDRPQPSQIYYNYNTLTRAWEDVFGSENVKLLAFKETPGFLGFMGRHLGLDLGSMPVPDRVNEAIDVRVMAMANAMIESGKPQRIDHRIIDQLPVEQKVQLDRETAQGIQNRFTASNQKLVARRADLKSGNLALDYAKFPTVGNLDILEQPCSFSSALADLVTHYNDLQAKT